MGTIEVYLETGKRRTFAAAHDWPGWCRIGKDEAAALGALVEYGPRYARVLRGTGLGFEAPADAAAFAVVERLAGNDTTDFGAPDVPPARDAEPLDGAGLERARALLEAIWGAFDGAIEAATGRELRLGLRGGGRDLAKLVGHVVDGDAGYLRRVGQKVPPAAGDDPAARLAVTRETVLAALAAGRRGEIPARGPRGGAMWTARFFVRRVAWHTLDHAWELEDRIVP